MTRIKKNKSSELMSPSIRSRSDSAEVSTGASALSKQVRSPRLRLVAWTQGVLTTEERDPGSENSKRHRSSSDSRNPRTISLVSSGSSSRSSPGGSRPWAKGTSVKGDSFSQNKFGQKGKYERKNQKTIGKGWTNSLGYVKLHRGTWRSYSKAARGGELYTWTTQKQAFWNFITSEGHSQLSTKAVIYPSKPCHLQIEQTS